MIIELDFYKPNWPKKRKQLRAECDLGPAQPGWPPSITGKPLDYQKEDWVDVFQQDVRVFFNSKRYKFNAPLNDDGTFELTQDW